MNAFSDRRRRPMFSRGPNFGLRALLLLVLLVALLAYARLRTGSLENARDWAMDGLQPVIWAVDLPRALDQFMDRFAERDKLAAENRALRDKQLVLEAQQEKMAALEAENSRLRELLSSASSLSQKVLIAEIIAISQDPYRHQIMLNKGSDDGVYKGQALVDAHGVLGQVIQVSPKNCVGLLITDPSHGIPVEINRTGLQTFAVGRGDGYGLSLPYLPGNADVKVGDLIVSSGLGGRFPAGYPVGEIHELRHAAGETFMEAIAFPSAHLNQGRQALLVWNETPKTDDLPPLPINPAPMPEKAARKAARPHP